MENQDKSSFSLDNDDEEVIEEQVIERDEEYDDDDYDDDYDDEYDDEEYDDDEDYDDEEDYDDGYNDDYYDDRLNKVLDEIAEIKRGMNNSPSTVVQSQPPFVPQYIYQPNAPAPSATSEVVMYNEISRLRDELAKNQSSLEMQKEITRMKEDMARDQKFAESQYNAEIRRLQDRIDDLLKNADSPQSEQLPAGQQTQQPRIEGGKSANLDKLISVNEAVLRVTKESNSRIQSEIEQLKAKLEALPSGEDFTKLLAEAKSATDGAIGSEEMRKLVSQLEAVRNAISVSSGSVAAPIQNVARDDISTGELLLQLCEIKNVLGASSEDALAHTQKLVELVGEYKKTVRFVKQPDPSYKEKLVAVAEFAKKLTDANESGTADLYDGVNAMYDELADMQITRAIYNDLAAYCFENGIVLTPQTRASVEHYFALCDSLAAAAPASVCDFLPDLIAEKDKLENNAHATDNAQLLDKIKCELFNEPRNDWHIADLVNKLKVLRSGVVAEIPHIEYVYNESDESANTDEESETVNADRSVIERLTELKTAIEQHSAAVDEKYAELAEKLDSVSAVAADAAAQAMAARQSAADDKEEDQAESAEKAEQTEKGDDENPFREVNGVGSVDDFFVDPNSMPKAVAAEPSPEYKEALDKVNDKLNELGSALQSATDTDSVSAALEEIRNNYLEVLQKLVDISEQINNPPVPDDRYASAEQYNVDSAQSTESVATESATTDNTVMLEDLAYIRDKLTGYDEFLTQISDLRNDVLNLSTALDFTSQFNAQLDEIGAQFDKLYDDISNVIIETENNLSAKFDSVATAEGLENAKSEIINETRALRDALSSNPEVGEAIDNLRGDIASFTDMFAANADVTAADRQKLLEDVAYLREQAEAAISSEHAEGDAQPADSAAGDAFEKIYAYLDDISAQVALISGIADDIAISGDAAAQIPVIAEDTAITKETVASVHDAVNAALDALTPISEKVSAILDRLDAAEEYDDTEQDIAQDEVIDDEIPADYSEDLGEIKDNLNTILDTLPLLPQSDDLVTARDNTFSILDTLTVMSQNDDIVTTRDNVAAILEAVNALSESIANAGNTEETDDDPVLSDVAAIRMDTSALVEAIPATMSEDWTTIVGSATDVAAIRQMLETPKEDGSAALDGIIADVTAVLDKLDAMTQASEGNKQEILDAVADVREKIHLGALDETMTAVGIDDETRETLVTEIADVRERLSNIEGATQTLDDINAHLANLSAALDARAEEQTPVAFDNTVLDEINDKLNALLDGNIAVATETDSENSALNGISADIAEILARLDNNGTGDAVQSEPDENIQNIIDSLAVIKEKIDAQADYDALAEILSLREDVKAARIVDQDEVSGELEAIKNELAAISSGNILDEIRALREDVAALEGGSADVGESNPTGGELNLVLNEIVALRDEVFALRDEVLGATVPEDEQSTETDAEAEEEVQGEDDSINIILDELTALRIDQNALGDNINELKDTISRRTTVSADAEGATPSSDELNVVLDEIINLKNEIEQKGENNSVTAERLDEITAQVADLAELVASLKTDVTATDEKQVIADNVDGIADLRKSVDDLAAATSEQLDNITAAIADIGLEQGVTGENNAPSNDVIDDIYADIGEIKNVLATIVPADVTADISELRSEIEQLRAENERLRSEQNESLAAELAEIKSMVRDMTLTQAPVANEDGDTSYAALIDEIKLLRDEVASAKAPAPATLDNDAIEALREALSLQTESNAPLADALGDIRDEIAQLRSLATVTADGSGSVEVAAMRNELEQLRAQLSSPDHLDFLAEDVTSIKADVQTLKEEPDLGVMSEILALRDEFQALREEIEDVKRIAGQTDRQSDEQILAEVQSLRDQLFAISMANVNDTASGENNYESYNNIILDELASLHERIDTAGSSDEILSVTEELEQLRASLDKREDTLDALARRVAKLDNDATNNKILEELDRLHNELANQREADLTTLNFMSEMAHLLERQNSYIAENTGSKISDEIESLKAELASTDTVAEEVAKLREAMSQAALADNDAILAELAELREQMSAEKPSKENERILQEIARLRDEMTSIADIENRRNNPTDDDLSGSLSDLKSSLNQIADIIEPTDSRPAKTEPAQKPSGKRGRPKGSTNKNSGNKKSSGSGKKGKSKKSSVATANTYSAPADYDDLDKRITEQSASLGIDNLPSTKDVSDRLDRLAQRVANKLIIEQLVEQLGEDGKTEEQVDRILGELPAELTTVALDDQSEQVRKLANELAMSKLRDRLATDDGNDGEE